MRNGKLRPEERNFSGAEATADNLSAVEPDGTDGYHASFGEYTATRFNSAYAVCRIDLSILSMVSA